MKVRGYTLIEVIIVMTIIAILAGIFMFFSGNFVSRARLDIAADTVLAAFSDVQEEVKSGVRMSSADSGAKCLGLKFQGDGVFRVFAEYDASVDVPCHVSSITTGPAEEIVLGEHIFFRDFIVDDSDDFELPLVVLYEPPHGKMRVFEDKKGSWNLVDKNISFSVSYGETGNLFKKIVIDPAIGRVSFSPLIL